MLYFSEVYDSSAINVKFNSLFISLTQSKEVANRNLEAIDKLSEAIFNQKVPGQEDTEIRTKSAILTCRRALKTDVFYYPIVAGNASVQFPNISHLLPEEEVDIQVSSNNNDNNHDHFI